MLVQQTGQRVEHVNCAVTADCDCVYSSTACSFQCTYVDTPIKPWKCNWLRYLTFYCLATKRNKKKEIEREREKKVNALLSLNMTRGGRTHNTTHWAEEPAGSTRSHPNGELETLFLLSVKRVPEPSCPTIKLSWQIYSVGFTDVFMNTDETTFKSTPVSEYFPACLTLSNGTLPCTLGTFNCSQTLFTAVWLQENSPFPSLFRYTPTHLSPYIYRNI